MQYNALGNTGMRVSRLGLGAATFGREIDEKASHRILDYAVDHGINFIDTAASYADGMSEKVIGRWLKKKGNEVVLASKVGYQFVDSPLEGERPYSQWHLRRRLEATLRRMQIERLDLYQLHKFCPDADLDETVGELSRLVEEGKIRYFGCSNFTAEQLEESLTISKRLHIERFETLQSALNLVNHVNTLEAIPLCQREQIGLVAYSPLGAGFLTGKYCPNGSSVPKGTRFDVVPGHQRIYFSETNFRLLSRFKELAADWQVTLPQLAMAWATSVSGVTSVLVGARTTGHIDQAFRSLERGLSDDELKRISGLLS